MATLTTSYQLLGEKYLGSSYGDLYIRIYAKYNSQNINNNNSSVTYQSRLYFTGNYIVSKNPTTVTTKGTGASDNTISWDSFEGKQDGTYKKGETVLKTISGTVTHDNSGNASISASAYFNAGPWGWSATASGSANLPTIPRETDLPSFASAEVEQTTTITLSPKISGAKHSIKLVFGNLTNWLKADGSLGTSEVKLSGKSLPITIPTSYYGQFDGTRKTGTLYLYTYNGNTKIGSGKSKSFKITCNSGLCTPVITATVKDTNNKTVALTGDEKTLVANASNVLVTPTIRVSDSDDGKGYVTSKTVNSIVFTSGTYTVNKATSKDFIISATNSRGYTGTKTVSMNRVVPYIPLTFNIKNLYRPEPTTGEIRLEYDGKYYPGEFTNNLGDSGVFNSLEIKWFYKLKKDSEYTAGGTLTPTINTEKNTYSGSLSLGTNFDYQQQYDFRFKYKDKIVSTSIDKIVTRGLPIFWWSEDAVHIIGDLYVEGKINPS